MCINQTYFTITELRDFVYGLLETCKERLLELTYLEKEEHLLELELASLHDNPIELVEG